MPYQIISQINCYVAIWVGLNTVIQRTYLKNLYKMNKVQYDLKPPKLEAVGNGSWKYRWDIEPIEVETPDGVSKTMFQCYEVLMRKTPTIDNVTQAVITGKWPQSVEAKLINDYNAALLNVLSEDFIQPYLAFLNERNRLKSEIKEYFNEIV